MIRTDKRLRACRVLLVCTLVFIWGNSLLPGDISGALSNWVRKLLSALFHTLKNPTARNHLLRKLAHYTEFACLGALLCWYMGMKGRPKAGAFLLGAAAACLDETIQIFVPGRGAGLRDVCIDCCGVVTGMILLQLGHTYFYKKRMKQSMEDA